MVGTGLTVIFMKSDVPGQPPKVGVTLKRAVTGAFVAFVATNELMFPVPVAPKPIELVLFAHVYVVFATAPVNEIAPEFAL